MPCISCHGRMQSGEAKKKSIQCMMKQKKVNPLNRIASLIFLSSTSSILGLSRAIIPATMTRFASNGTSVPNRHVESCANLDAPRFASPRSSFRSARNTNIDKRFSAHPMGSDTTSQNRHEQSKRSCHLGSCVVFSFIPLVFFSLGRMVDELN